MSTVNTIFAIIRRLELSHIDHDTGSHHAGLYDWWWIYIYYQFLIQVRQLEIQFAHHCGEAPLRPIYISMLLYVAHFLSFFAKQNLRTSVYESLLYPPIQNSYVSYLIVYTFTMSFDVRPLVNVLQYQVHKYRVNRDPAVLYTTNPKCHHNVSLHLVDCIKQRGIKYQTARCTKPASVWDTLFPPPGKVCDPGAILWIFLQMFWILRKYFSLHNFCILWQVWFHRFFNKCKSK